MPQPIKIVLIAAVADNGVIGRDNAMPWHLSSDLKRFKALTMGKPVVMGRRTYLSIGRPLPGRTNIVVSRDRNFAAPGVLVAGDLTSALEAARGDALRRGVAEIAVIGGTDIFAQCMHLADRMEITQVHLRPQGDVFFPPIDGALWREAARSAPPAGPKDDAGFEFVTYERIQDAGVWAGIDPVGRRGSPDRAL
jgi:dihydrofolate reductase